MAKQIIAQALTNIFGAAAVRGGDSNLFDVASQGDPWSDEQIAAAQAIAAEYGWKVTVARRGRWISIEGPVTSRTFTQAEINAARDAMSR
jgi:hypothetical protein